MDEDIAFIEKETERIDARRATALSTLKAAEREMIMNPGGSAIGAAVSAKDELDAANSEVVDKVYGSIVVELSPGETMGESSLGHLNPRTRPKEKLTLMTSVTSTLLALDWSVYSGASGSALRESMKLLEKASEPIELTRMIEDAEGKEKKERVYVMLGDKLVRKTDCETQGAVIKPLQWYQLAPQSAHPYHDKYRQNVKTRGDAALEVTEENDDARHEDGDDAGAEGFRSRAHSKATALTFDADETDLEVF